MSGKNKDELGYDRSLLIKSIPTRWITGANRHGPRASQVGVELWYLAGLQESLDVEINLSSLTTAPNVNRSSASRGLKQLENANLVKADRQLGKKTLVKLLCADAGACPNHSCRNQAIASITQSKKPRS